MLTSQNKKGSLKRDTKKLLITKQPMSMSTSNNLLSYKSSNDSAFDVYEIQHDVQLAANIINARMRRGMTQTELAKEMDMVQPAIARSESGNRPPSHKLLKKIARALGAKLIPQDFQFQEELSTSMFLSQNNISIAISSDIGCATTQAQNEDDPTPFRSAYSSSLANSL